MTTLTEKIWRPFRLLDYFDFIKGDQNDMSALEAGDLPLVSAKNSNNGYKAFVADNGKKIFSGHCLTLNTDGDGGAGIAYYQPTKFLLDTHVTALYPKIEMSREMLLFISRSITIQRGKFGHGYSLNNKRLKIFQVMLPVNDDGSPDFVFMENYVRAVEGILLQRYRDFAQEKLSALETKKIPPLNEKRWAEFLFTDVFRIEKGFYNKKPTASGAGKIPFLGATENNNGITEFYTYDEIANASKVGYGKNESIDRKIFEGNAIAVTNNGSVGHAFYQPTPFTCSHDINPLYLKNYQLNESIALFLIDCIEKQGICFAYARKWRPIRMINSKIFLPVNDEGAPDFEYMEAYAKNLEAEKYRKYLAYIGGG